MGTELDNRKGIAETIGNIKDSEALGILAAVAAKRSTNVCKYLCKELKRQGGEKEGEGYTRMIQSILSQGINVNASSDLGTPIHLAAQSCKQDVKTFVDHGANEQIFEEVDKVTESWGDQVAEHEAQVTSQGQKKSKKDSDLLQETLPVTSSQAQEPDLNVKSKDEYSDLSKRFTTDQTFESREDLIHWAKDTGKKCGTVVVITKSDKPTSRRPARLHLSCEWHKNAVRKMHAKRLTGYCPFQLRGIYICNSNDKWKVKVHFGRHNHQLANNSSITLSSLPRERVQIESRQIGCRKNISQSNQSKKREPSVVEYTQPSKSQSVTLSKQKPQPTKKLKLASTRRGLCDISTDHFWKIIRPFIDNVHNVALDGQCGFRAVAAGLGLNSEIGWLTVREELIVELNCFKDEYMKIYGGEAHIEQLLDVLGCTTSPCPTKYWFTLPKMGHLVATRYQVVFVCISHVDALTFVPLRSHPPTDEPKVIAIGNVDRVHFVPIKLKPSCPIPQPVKIWVDRKLFEGWGDLLKNRTDAFKALVDHQPSNQETAKVDVVILD